MKNRFQLHRMCSIVSDESSGPHRATSQHLLATVLLPPSWLGGEGPVPQSNTDSDPAEPSDDTPNHRDNIQARAHCPDRTPLRRP